MVLFLSSLSRQLAAPRLKISLLRLRRPEREGCSKNTRGSPPPTKKYSGEGRIPHRYLGTASTFQQAKAHAALCRLLARHTEGKKTQGFLLVIYGSHLIKV